MPIGVPLSELLAAPAPLYRFLDATGDGTGSKDATGDYSITPARFRIAPAAGELFVIHRMIVEVIDAGVFRAQDYGAITGGVANGIALAVRRDGADVFDLTDGLPVKTNGGWGQHCYDAQLKDWGSGNTFLGVRWSFDKAGTPLVLNGDEAEALAVYLADDFTGLLGHTFLVQGYRTEIRQ